MRYGCAAAAAAAPRALHYADLGGVEDVLADIQELIEYPLKHPEVSPPCMRFVNTLMH
jgi:ribosome biogenesis ATPase